MSTGSMLDPVRNGETHAKVDVDLHKAGVKNRSLYARAKVAVVGFFSRKKRKRNHFQEQRQEAVTSFTDLGTNTSETATGIDDRLNVFQDGIKVMSADGDDPTVTTQLNTTVVGLLHNEKQRPRPIGHPVSATQSSSIQYPLVHRVPKSLTFTPLPDPRVVFDKLFKEHDFVDHPNGISGLALALLLIIQLSLFRIDAKKPEYNEIPPYLDLPLLYGANDSETNLVRLKDGRGMLSPDSFVDNRVTLLPPAVSVLLILWNRNHNYVAQRLLLNNEDNKWVNPYDYPLSTDRTVDDLLQSQDDEIFKIARLLNCVQFKNVVSEDLLKILIGLPHVGESANLDILIDHSHSEKGKGHVSSVEFNLLYNWTAMMAREDIQAIERTAEGNLPTPIDQVISDITHPTYSTTNTNPRQRDCAGLKRGIDGRFKDEDLAGVLQNTTEYFVGASGARRTSPHFSTAETMVIERARQWGVCSFNDFREFLGLKVLHRFAEWNSNPDVARAAEDLYANMDNLELYPGLQAEETMPGSGLGLGYTMTYGILVDIVTTIRSDARFTTELTPARLTRWGYNDCTRPVHNGAFGTMLPRLLQRNLPDNYPYNNVYGLFPLVCPGHTRAMLHNMISLHDKYDCERPKPRRLKIVEGKNVIKHIMGNPSTYRPIYGKDIDVITDAYSGYVLGFRPDMRYNRDQMMTLYALVPNGDFLPRYAGYFGKTATKLIESKSVQYERYRSVDVVRDVINVTCTRWAVETLCGISLSGHDERVKNFRDDFLVLHGYIFCNIDPENGWSARTAALDVKSRLAKDILQRIPIHNLSDTGWIEFLNSYLADISAFVYRNYQEVGTGREVPQDSSTSFLTRIVKLNPSLRGSGSSLSGPDHLGEFTNTPGEEALANHRIVANILGLAVVISVQFAQACALAVDLYLRDEYKEERKEIIRLSTMSKGDALREDANTKIIAYIRKAQRLGPPTGFWRDVIKSDIIPLGPEYNDIRVIEGDRIFFDFNKTYMSAADPITAKIDPDQESYVIEDMAIHKHPAASFVRETMSELFKAIFRLKNLRRGMEKDGQLGKSSHPVPSGQLIDGTTGIQMPFPPSLILLYDDDGSSERPPTTPKNEGLLTGAKNEKLRQLIRRIVVLVVLFILIFVVFYMFRFIFAWIASSRSSLKRRVHVPPPKPEDVKTEFIECPLPTTVFDSWGIHTFLPDADNRPLPLQYVVDHPNPHKLSIVDIDARDTRMAVYVDNVLRGITSHFELNKTANCGEEVRTCLLDGFSSGMTVVRPGQPVRIEWIGNDFDPDLGTIDWGEERSRRIMWQREYCS